MLGVIRIFFRAEGGNPWTVLACLLAAGLFEGIGVATLFPLVSVASSEQISEDNPINRIALDVLGYLGLPPDLPVLISIAVGALILKALVQFLAMVHVGYSMAQVSTGLRTTVLKNLLRVRWPYYTAQPVGRFANALSNDATRAAATFRKAAEFLAHSIQTLVYLALALVNNWQLTLVAFGVGAGIVLVLNSLVRTARRAGQKQTDRTKQFVTYLTDVLNNIRPLKAMGRHGAFIALLDHKNALLRKALRRQVLSVQTLQVLQAVFMAIAIGIGGYVALEHLRLEFGQLLVMGYVIWKLLKNMATVQSHYQKAVLLESPYLALEGIIAETGEAGEELRRGAVPELRRGCSFRNVRFGYGGEEVLKGIDLEIPARCITVLSGMSGAGKTTVTDLLLGFYKPASGEVLVDGRPLDQIDLVRWRRMIGYVPQELSLLHDTVIANVTLGDSEVSDDQAIAALKMAGAWDFVSTLPDGLETHVGEKGSQISGGQRQRLALARALATRPRLLILDEVTSALDKATEEALCATLRELSRDLTILAVSHRPKVIEFADVVYHLADGQAQQATPANARVRRRERRTG